MLRKAAQALSRGQLFEYTSVVGPAAGHVSSLWSSTTGACRTCTRSTAGPLDERQFHHAADKTFEYLQDELDTYIEDSVPDGDIAFEAGVLTLSVGGGKGTYVLNKQGPNLQIWSSSPISGPVRYDWMDGKWQYARDGSELMSTLSKELSSLCGAPIALVQPVIDTQ